MPASTCIAEVLELFFMLCKGEVKTTAVIFFCVLDPIPGGCNLEFDLEVDPNIYLDYTLVDTHIKFAPANLGYTRCVEKLQCTEQDLLCLVFGQDHKTRFC